MASLTCLAVCANYWLGHSGSHLIYQFPENQTGLLHRMVVSGAKRAKSFEDLAFRLVHHHFYHILWVKSIHKVSTDFRQGRNWILLLSVPSVAMPPYKGVWALGGAIHWELLL